MFLSEGLPLYCHQIISNVDSLWAGRSTKASWVIYEVKVVFLARNRNLYHGLNEVFIFPT